MSATAFTPPLVEDTTADHTDDVAAIRQIIANAETAFNTNDADLLTGDFTANAAVVNAAGTLITGFDALLDANRRGLAGFLKDQYARYEVADITFLRPDVAIAHKRAWATTADGEPLDNDHAMIALYVLVKQGNRWYTAARQNTLVPKDE
ncbi:SgcJ/EcaC family oxidoreductase [Nocardia sp. NPDC051787]|uniref:SgcJ/EcaC family oxidoreductase n=1 Tax=Nocardia sp. NPDC051787 TaxID=3155415 RepID=UPI0034208787